MGLRLANKAIKLNLLFFDNTVKKMSQAGYIVFKEPWNAPWGQRYAIIKDVDANLISLFAPL